MKKILSVIGIGTCACLAIYGIVEIGLKIFDKYTKQAGDEGHEGHHISSEKVNEILSSEPIVIVNDNTMEAYILEHRAKKEFKDIESIEYYRIKIDRIHKTLQEEGYVSITKLIQPFVSSVDKDKYDISVIEFIKNNVSVNSHPYRMWLNKKVGQGNV